MTTIRVKRVVIVTISVDFFSISNLMDNPTMYKNFSGKSPIKSIRYFVSFSASRRKVNVYWGEKAGDGSCIPCKWRRLHLEFFSSPTQPSLFCLLRTFLGFNYENVCFNFRNEEPSSKAWHKACLLALWKWLQRRGESHVKTF